ncbi:MAG TPA: hypothetical protein VGN55_06565 [Xanthobacteraceae bacterium]|jgi:hypothetical protein
MTICRVALVAVLAVASAHSAQAQFGGMPGMPGSPGMGGSGFGGPPAGPPPACLQLMTLRDETQKNGAAIAAASKRKAEPAEACKLFKVFIASEAKFIQGMSENSTICGVPPQAIKQYQEGHGKASLIAKQVCDAAEHPRQTGPSLSDALNSAPVIPDTNNTNNAKAGRGGTFDTLQGNPLTR